MQTISFYNNDRNPPLRDRKKLKLFLGELFRLEKKNLNSLTYIFCSDDYLLEINKEFLKHDFYTDIITFDMGVTPKDIIGEIYISVDRIKDNAKKMNVSFNNELHRVIFHGALHLCGYADKKKNDKVKMRNREDHYLLKFKNMG